MNLRTKVETRVVERVPDEQGRPDVICLKAHALKIVAPPEPEKHPHGYRVIVRCPFCGGTHSHLWRGPGGELQAQRVAHCTAGRAVYPLYRGFEYRIDATHLEGGA